MHICDSIIQKKKKKTQPFIFNYCVILVFSCSNLKFCYVCVLAFSNISVFLKNNDVITGFTKVIAHFKIILSNKLTNLSLINLVDSVTDACRLNYQEIVKIQFVQLL